MRLIMISTVRGEFSGVKGTVVYELDNVVVSSVMATIDCTTGRFKGCRSLGVSLRISGVGITLWGEVTINLGQDLIRN
jgi:hypothetical protein